MKKYAVLSWLSLVVSIGLGVISYIILPDTVITQLSLNAENATTMPKLAAIAIPFILSVVGSLLCIFAKDQKPNKKIILITIVGLIIYIVMLGVNLFAK